MSENLGTAEPLPEEQFDTGDAAASEPLETNDLDGPGRDLGGGGGLDGGDLTVNHAGEFAELYREAVAQGGAAPGRLRIDGAVPPWSENPANVLKPLYHRPEGHQARLEQAYAEQGFDPQTFLLINPEPDLPGRRCNCGECARATASMLDGQPVVACELQADGESDTVMTLALGRADRGFENFRGDAFRDYDDASYLRPDTDVEQGFCELERELRDAGPGTHAIVAVDWKRPPGAEPGARAGGHFFNVANIDGQIVYLDAQAGVIGDRDDPLFTAFAASASTVDWIRSETRP